jgi:hypothetical protein
MRELFLACTVACGVTGAHADQVTSDGLVSVFQSILSTEQVCQTSEADRLMAIRGIFLAHMVKGAADPLQMKGALDWARNHPGGAAGAAKLCENFSRMVQLSADMYDTTYAQLSAHNREILESLTAGR